MLFNVIQTEQPTLVAALEAARHQRLRSVCGATGILTTHSTRTEPVQACARRRNLARGTRADRSYGLCAGVVGGHHFAGTPHCPCVGRRESDCDSRSATVNGRL